MEAIAYISPNIILASASIMVGDREFKVLPIGFYNGLIQEGFEKLALDTFFAKERKNITLDGGLVYALPKDCFNIRNVYIFTGDICDITSSRKVYHKRNYYTQGHGYLANNKGGATRDPFYDNSTRLNDHYYGDQIVVRGLGDDVNHALFYNIDKGNIMISSTCLNVGTKLHIQYDSTGCSVEEAPIIPTFLRTAMQDFTTEGAIRARMANDADPRRWQSLQQIYDHRLNAPYTGSWEAAEYRVKIMSSDERNSLSVYLGRGAWANGL